MTTFFKQLRQNNDFGTFAEVWSSKDKYSPSNIFKALKFSRRLHYEFAFRVFNLDLLLLFSDFFKFKKGSEELRKSDKNVSKANNSGFEIALS